MTRDRGGFVRQRSLSAFLFVCVVLAGTFTSPWERTAAAQTPAPERKLMRYVVVKGDTCQGLAQRIYGDRRRIDLLHQFNDLGPVPHHLEPGLVLFFPPPDQAPPLAGPDAKLSHVRNRVTVENPAPKLGQTNEGLNRGNRVSTGEGASAEIVFRDETRIQLGENTLVVVLGDSSKKAAQKSLASDTELVSGELRAHLGALAGDSPVAVKTTHGEAELGPGEAQVQADAKGTRLSVFTGSSKLSSKGGSVTLSAGYGSRTNADGTLSAPHALPSAPAWTVTPPPSYLSAGRLADFAASYGPGPAGKGKQAVQWHVQVARDPGFNDLVLDQREPADHLQISVKRLGSAHYYARVSAIDDEGFEGPYAPTIRKTVILARLLRDGEGRAANAQITPGNVYCGLDNGRLVPLSTAMKKSRGVFHKLRCGPSGDARLASEIEIPEPLQLPYRLKATLEQGDGDARRGLLVLDVVDAKGQPVTASRIERVIGAPGTPAAAVTPTAGGAHEETTPSAPSTADVAGTADVGVGSLEEDVRDGQYRAAVWWEAGATALPLRVSVDGGEAVDVGEVALPGPTPPKVEERPPEPPPAEKPPPGCHCTIAGGEHSDDGGHGLWGTFALAAGALASKLRRRRRPRCHQVNCLSFLRRDSLSPSCTCLPFATTSSRRRTSRFQASTRCVWPPPRRCGCPRTSNDCGSSCRTFPPHPRGTR